MMTMLHSVWSGGGSAAGRRRSLLALGALLALIASVLVWAAPTQAQGSNQPPVAIALTPSVSEDGNTMTLDGTLSFDPDDGATGNCAGCTYKWEVVTTTWKFLEGFGTGLNVTTPAAEDAGVETATIDVENVSFASLVASNGAIIEFRLTVTDSDGASDSDTTTYNIMTNDTPTADISLSATLADPDAAEDATTAEKYTIDAVIDGPGENGNADNEWDIMEGALLVLDGSGSSDPDDDDLNYLWNLVYEAGSNTAIGYPAQDAAAANGSTLAVDSSAETGAKLSTESNGGADDSQLTVGRLNVARAATQVSQSPYQVVYTLAVTDAGADVTDDNTDDTALIRIVIHDQPADPEITAVLVDGDTDQDPQHPTDGIDTAFPPGDKYFVHESETARSITLSAVTFDADQDVNGDGNHTDGANTDADETPPTVMWSMDDSDDTAVGHQISIPADAEDGDVITVTATIPRTDVSKTVTFEVIESNTRPVATILTPNSDHDSDAATPNVASVTPEEGVYTLNGFGFDPDGGSTNSVWTQLIDGMPASPDDDDYVALTGAFSNTVSYSAPADAEAGDVILLSYTVFDDESTFDSAVVVVPVVTAPAAGASANAGDDQVVAPESTVILAASASGFDAADTPGTADYIWTVTGVSTNPSTTSLSARGSAQVHEDLNALLEVWTQNDQEGDEDSERTNIDEVLTAISGTTGGEGPFQFFEAPKLSAGLKYAQITFNVAVTADVGGNEETKNDTVTITIATDFFSSYIDTPDFCAGRSLGGPTTYPHDSDGDGVADVCSLASTRREAVARQNALDTLVSIGSTIDMTDSDGRTSPATLTDLVLGRDGVDAADPDGTPGNEDDVAEVSAIVGTCSRAKALGLETNDADACDDDATALTPLPDPVDPADAALFYSGVVSGPDFCTNRSLGGAQTYAHDSDDPKDGVADVCSLHTTRREAIARQMALVMFEAHAQFENAVKVACTALGSETFGASAEALAADACSVGINPQSPGSGTALPTPPSS